MIIKVVNSCCEDKYLANARHIAYRKGDGCIILEVYGEKTHTNTVGSISESVTTAEQVASLFLKLFHGDRVFVMNDAGKTVDCKRIVLEPK